MSTAAAQTVSMTSKVAPPANTEHVASNRLAPSVSRS